MSSFFTRVRWASRRLPIGVAVCAGGVSLGSPAASSSAANDDDKAARSAEAPHASPRMFIGDPDAFAKKWKKFSTDGMDKLLVIADFDQTLTPYYKLDGALEVSSHAVLLSSSVLDPAIVEHEHELSTRYFPIYMSPSLSQEEKLPFMIDWWKQSEALLLDCKLDKAQIRAAVTESDLSFRNGFHDIFRLLTTENVPVLIFSAGLYDVIHAILEKEYASKWQMTLPSNLHVVSNMMQFDASGTISGFAGTMIHSANKTAEVLLDTPFWKQCRMEKRHNIILLGDSRGDVTMANGLEYKDDEIIRIGFLNTHVDELLDEYLRLYDVVLTHDASLRPVEMLLHQLQKTSSSS